MNNRQAAIQSAIELLREEGYEVKEPPKPERIEVVFTWINLGSGENKIDAPFSHFFKTDKAIPEDKRPALIRAIEEVLNEKDKEWQLEFAKKAYKESGIFLTPGSTLTKMFTEKELLEAENKAFDAARLIRPLPFDHKVFETFSDYKSHNQQSK